MNRLEAFGIGAGNDQEHRLLVDYDQLLAENYFGQAEELLETVSTTVLSGVVPHLEDYEGELQPGGFMVFPLGLHRLGSLRLHVWATGLDRESDRGPNIHNHAWLLASLVLAGTYSDIIYEAQNINASDHDSEALGIRLARLFRTMRNAKGEDVLMNDGTHVKPIPILERHIPSGQIHRIERDVYHVTTIPKEEFAATLVLNSPAFAETTNVLSDNSNSEIVRTRIALDLESKLLAKEQLLKAVKE